MYVSNTQPPLTVFTRQALLLPLSPPRQPCLLPKEATPSLCHHPSTYSCQPSSLQHSAVSLHLSSPEPPLVSFMHVCIASPPIQQSHSCPTELISLLPHLPFTTDNCHQSLHSPPLPVSFMHMLHCLILFCHNPC